MPDSVLINGESYTLAQFLYLAAIATININNGDFSDLDSKDAANPDNYMLMEKLQDQYPLL